MHTHTRSIVHDTYALRRLTWIALLRWVLHVAPCVSVVDRLPLGDSKGQHERGVSPLLLALLCHQHHIRKLTARVATLALVTPRRLAMGCIIDMMAALAPGTQMGRVPVLWRLVQMGHR